MWEPLCFVVPEAVRLQVGDSSSMQYFHFQTVCSGRDSWSPISQRIWQLQQKALSPVNIKQRRTEHCKAFCRRLRNRAGSTLLHCHPETTLWRSSPWVHPNQYQLQGDYTWLFPPALWSLLVLLERCRGAGLLWQDSSVPWELLFPPTAQALKRTQGCFPLSSSGIKTLQSKGFTEMHQAGVVINSGWGPLLWLSVCVSLVGKGWVSDFHSC